MTTTKQRKKTNANTHEHELTNKQNTQRTNTTNINKTKNSPKYTNKKGNQSHTNNTNI